MAKEVALKPGSPVKNFQIRETPNEEKGEIRPVFVEKELRELERIGGQQKEDGEWWTPDGRQILNKALAQKFILIYMN